MTRLTIPQPPSVNGMWRAVGGRALLSRRGRAYRAEGLRMLAGQPLPPEPLEGRLQVTLELYQRDRRKSDIDNYCKGALDLLTHAAVWVDDSQIDVLIIRRCGVLRGGRVDVLVEVLP